MYGVPHTLVPFIYYKVFIEYTFEAPSPTFDVRSCASWLKHQEGVSQASGPSRIWPRFPCKLSVLMCVVVPITEHLTTSNVLHSPL